MDIQRAEHSDLKYLKFKQSLTHNTAFIAKENNIVISIFEYSLFRTVAQIVNISFHHSVKDRDELFAAFMNQLFYWNPYVTEVIAVKEFLSGSILYRYGFRKYTKWIYKNKRAAKIVKLSINSIVPEQLTVNIQKVKNAATWIKSPRDIIVSFIYINGSPVVIDGYSRLTVAYYKQLTYVYGYVEKTNDTMMTFYKESLKWCKDDNINSIADLSKRLATPEEHQKIWVDKCSEYFKKH